mmetsp:Transcript_447/g.1649  ORF Transcript_447/g.1649 Transcript_447/m.1649 type:complete len:313 (+) Transcript_447:582-1520(+)
MALRRLEERLSTTRAHESRIRCRKSLFADVSSGWMRSASRTGAILDERRWKSVTGRPNRSLYTVERTVSSGRRLPRRGRSHSWSTARMEVWPPVPRALWLVSSETPSSRAAWSAGLLRQSRTSGRSASFLTAGRPLALACLSSCAASAIFSRMARERASLSSSLSLPRLARAPVPPLVPLPFRPASATSPSGSASSGGTLPPPSPSLSSPSPAAATRLLRPSSWRASPASWRRLANSAAMPPAASSPKSSSSLSSPAAAPAAAAAAAAFFSRFPPPLPLLGAAAGRVSLRLRARFGLAAGAPSLSLPEASVS